MIIHHIECSRRDKVGYTIFVGVLHSLFFLQSTGKFSQPKLKSPFSEALTG